MVPEERRRAILEALREARHLSVAELSERAFASEATIRRDLVALEAEGSVRRSRGGASYVDPEFVHWPLAFRNKEHYAEKAAIARAAVALVEDGESVLLDSSSTCLCLAQQLGVRRGLQVATCSIPAAQALGGVEGCSVELAGGTYRPQHLSVSGADTCRFFVERRAGMGFVSGCALDAEFGLSDYDIGERDIKRAMRRGCETLVALVDHTKLGKTSYLRDLALRELDVLVCDEAVPDGFADACEEAGVRLVVAGERGGRG